jgi:hypothetical protein
MKKVFEGGGKLWAGPITGQDGKPVLGKGDTLSIEKIESMAFLVKGVVGTLK